MNDDANNVPVTTSGPVSPVPYGYAQAPARAVDPADSLGSWMVATLVSAIPLVGFIYLLVVAFGGTASVSRRNWARALFAWQLIFFGLVLLLMLTGGLTAFFSYNS